MAVFRVEKTRNYTVMSNYHLRDKSLSLKAKGLLSLMLSLPEEWDYTTKGLAYICKDGVGSIRTAVRELEGAGYIVRQRERHEDGTLGGIEYTILEQPRAPEPPKRENPVQAENTGDAPKRAFPEQVKPVLGKPEQENPAQLNIEEQSKEELSTDVMNSFPSFPHEGKSLQESGMERRETYRAQIMTNVDYAYLVGYTEVDRGRLDELVGLMLDTVCSTKATIRVAGEELPAEVVRSRLLKLTGAHLLYVLDRINENTTTGSSISTGRTWNIESSHDAEKPCNAAPCPSYFLAFFVPTCYDNIQRCPVLCILAAALQGSMPRREAGHFVIQ